MPLIERSCVGALCLVGALGCATSGPVIAERDFVRSGSGDVPLRSLDVVVVVAGPARVSEGRFEVRGFPPPSAGVPLLEGPEEVQTRDALVAELARSLQSAGFQVALRYARAPAASAAPVSTSTTASSTTAPGAEPTPPSPPNSGPTLVAGEDLDAIRRASTADAVLVVRAVPVDRFTLDVGSGTRWEETSLGREQVRDSRPVSHEGRLLVGQAFLFERTSGVRLWSRQTPGYPDDGRLSAGHPFLASGYVQAADEAPAPGIVRATASARAFGRTILDGFPKAREGTEEARQALTSLDARAVAERDAFFDAPHWALELGAGWGGESSQLDVTLDQEPLASLGPGATTPVGMLRLAPRVAYIAPGGMLYALTVPIALAPSSFGRSYVRDNAMPTSEDGDRAVRVSVGGVTAVGAQAEVGRVFALRSDLFLVPRGGAFVDAWIVDASPAPWVEADTRVRVGATVGFDVWLRVGDLVYLRGGGDGRLGGDVAGGVVVGGALSVGAGLLL